MISSTYHRQASLPLALVLSGVVLVYSPVIAVAATKNVPAVAEIVEATLVDEKPAEEIKKPEHAVAVTKEMVPIASGRLGSQYSGYKIMVQNAGNNSIDIVSAQIVGGTNGQTGYAMVQKGSSAIWGTMLGAGLVLSIVTFGISFLVALVAWPIVGGVNAGANSRARKESMKFSDILPLGIVDSGQSVAVITLVPIGQTPVVKLTFRDMDGKLYSVSR